MALRPDIRKDIDSRGRRKPIALPGLIAISWRQLAQMIDGRTCGNIYRHLATEPTAIRSILINTGNFPPSFHSPAKGSGRHHLAVKSPPAAGRIIEHVNLLDQAQRKTTRLMSINSINCANARSNEVELYQSLRNPLIACLWRIRAGRYSVIVDGLNLLQNAAVKMN